MKLKIGVFFSSDIKGGGAYQQAVKTIDILEKIKNENAHFDFIYFTTKKNIEAYKKICLNLEIININLFDKLILIIGKFLRVFKKNSKLFKNKFEIYFKKLDIDLVYFIDTNILSYFMEDINFIITVWDMCHRDYIEFPELRYKFDITEILYTYVLKKAIAIIVETDTTKKYMMQRYGIDNRRIYVSKFVPTLLSTKEIKILDVKGQFQIKNDYIFYPAQLIPEKNHVYILDAIKILKEQYKYIIDVVFTGSDFGNLDYILNYSDKIGIKEQIHYLGFVENKVIPNLYKQSLALVMPTYGGYSNLPPIEAFSLEVPVFYSDLEGLREQVSDAAILINLNDPGDLAIKLIKLIKGEISKDKLIENGKKILNNWTDKDFMNVIVSILNSYSIKLRCWKNE